MSGRTRGIGSVVLLSLGLLSTPAFAFEPVSSGSLLVRQSLDEVVLSGENRVLLILANGERVLGKFGQAGGNAISVETDDGPRTFREAEVFQIYRLAQRSRSRGALYGALIGVGIALGAELVFPEEADASPFAMFALIGIASIPSGAAIGAIASGPGDLLVYQNPNLREPIVAGNLYFHFSGGANLVGGDPSGRGTSSRTGASGNATFEITYRPTRRWALGGQLLLANTGTWEWARVFPQGFVLITESRFITAPGFRVHFLPLTGRHEIDLSAGFSVFLQSVHLTQEGLYGGRPLSSTWTSTNLDYFLAGGGGYRYFIREKVSIGGEVEVYRGFNLPKPLVRFSMSLSLRS